MKKFNYLFLLLIGFSHTIFSQSPYNEKDTLTTIFNIGVRGMWSTGNTNRFSIQPNTSFSVFNNTFLLELDTLYDYMTIQKLIINNDFWSNSIFQFKYQKKWFPIISLNGGTAKSFNIRHFVTAGGGIGRNIFYKTHNHFLQIHGYGAYHNAYYGSNSRYKSFVLGGIIKSKIKLNKDLNVQWNLASYHSIEHHNYWGMRNFLIFNYVIKKQLSLNINHQLFYNKINLNESKKLNTTLLFGLNYHFKKN